MTMDPANAGGLYVDVEADLTGFSRTLQAKIDAATRDARARVRAEIDATRLQRDLDTAARRANATITVQAKVDRARLVADLRAAVTAAQRQAGTVKIGVDADTAAATAHIDEAARDRKATVEVNADAATAEAEIDVVARDRKTTIKADADTSGLDKIGSTLLRVSGSAIGLMKFPAIAQGIDLAVVAVGQLAGGLIAMGAAAAQAGGMLAAIPAAGAVLVGGLAPVIASFIGVGSAVKAMTAQQKTATSSSNTLAQAQEAAAQRVVAAQRSLRDAQQQQTETAITGAEGVQNAEESLAQAQQRARDAQVSLNQAREDAKQRLEDYEDQLANAALDERGARLAVERAKQALDAANRSATSTSLDRREAQLGYDQAVQNLDDVKDRNVAVQKEAKKAAKAGIDGDAGVVAAKKQVKDANQNVADQEQGLADARRQQANGNRDALEQVQAAQDGLTQAIKAQTQAQHRQTTQASAAAVALRNLSPAGRSFAQFTVTTLIPAMRQVGQSAQTAFLPFLQAGLQTAVTSLLPTMSRAMSTLGTVMGQTAESALTMMSSGPWKADFNTITHNVAQALRALGKALNPILTVVRDLTVAAGPFITLFARALAKAATHWSTLIGNARKSGRLTSFFQTAYDAASLLWGVIKNVGGALMNIVHAAAPAGRVLMRAFNGFLSNFREVTAPGTKGGNKLKAFFDHAVPGIEAAGRLIAGIIKAIGNISMQKNIAPLLDQITNQFLPALVTAFGQISSNFGPAFVRLLTNAVRLFGNLGGGSGALTAAADALDGVFKAINGLMHVPYIGFLVRKGLMALFAVGGVAAGIGLVGGSITKLTGKITGLIGKIPGLNRLLGRRGLGGAAKDAGDALAEEAAGPDADKKAALDDVEGAAGKASHTLGHKLASAARSVGGALVDAARGAGKFAANIAKAGAEAAVAAGKWLLLKVQVLATAAAELAQATAARVATAAQAALDLVMDANPIMLVVIAVTALVAAFIIAWRHSETFRRIVKGALGAVSDAFKGFGHWIERNWPRLRDILMAPFNALKAAWHWIQDHWQDVLGWLTNPIGSAVGVITGHIDTIKHAFHRAVDAIRTVWSTLSGIFNKPISFLVNTVYNNGIRWAWNKIADLVHLPELPAAHYGGRFALGGTVPGYNPGRDTVPAMLSPGEGVLVPEAVRGIGGASAIHAINRTFSSRVPGPTPRSDGRAGFAGGGWLSDAWDATGGHVVHDVSTAGGAVISGVGHVAGRALALIRQGAADAIAGLLGPVRGWVNSIQDGSGFTATLAAMFNRLIDGVIDKIKGSTAEHHTGGVVAGSGERMIRALGGEGVLTPAATGALGGARGIAALNRDPLAAVMAAAHRAGAAAPVIVDRHVVFEDGAIRVENPLPEPASDTINTRMRRLSAMGVFG